jgi:hypothetical protein
MTNSEKVGQVIGKANRLSVDLMWRMDAEGCGGCRGRGRLLEERAFGSVSDALRSPPHLSNNIWLR